MISFGLMFTIVVLGVFVFCVLLRYVIIMCVCIRVRVCICVVCVLIRVLCEFMLGYLLCSACFIRILVSV